VKSWCKRRRFLPVDNDAILLVHSGLQLFFVQLEEHRETASADIKVILLFFHIVVILDLCLPLIRIDTPLHFLLTVAVFLGHRLASLSYLHTISPGSLHHPSRSSILHYFAFLGSVTPSICPLIFLVPTVPPKLRVIHFLPTSTCIINRCGSLPRRQSCSRLFRLDPPHLRSLNPRNNSIANDPCQLHFLLSTLR
jgi:hypothetical protein